MIFSFNLSHEFTLIPHLDPAKSLWNSRKLISIARVIFSINLSHGFTPIPHLDPAKSPWNSRKLISIATVIFSINLSHGFTPIPHLDPAKSQWNYRKLISIVTVIFSFNLSHGVNPDSDEGGTSLHDSRSPSTHSQDEKYIATPLERQSLEPAVDSHQTPHVDGKF